MQYQHACKWWANILLRYVILSASSSVGSRCNLTVAYQSISGTPKDAPFLYVLQGAVSERQGQIPWDAFEGEEL